jgi:hypothetical protein
VNITLDLLKLVADKLRERADNLFYTEQIEVLEDAADALDDARDLLEELG